MILSLILAACGSSQPEPLYLTKEFYEWTCVDHENRSEVVVTTTTCENRESGLHYFIGEVFFFDGDSYKRQLKRTSPGADDCDWQTEFPLLDNE